MGTLATRLNAPVTVEVCGETLKVRRLSIDKIYQCVEQGLRDKDCALSGIELQNEAQKCVESGKFPMNSIVKIVREACAGLNEGFDMEDAQALCTPERIGDGQRIAEVALGEDPQKAGAEKNGAPETAAG